MNMQLDNYETEKLAKKTHLYQEGKRPKYLYYLKKGKVKAYRVHQDGKDYITDLFCRRFYGLSAVIGGYPL